MRRFVQAIAADAVPGALSADIGVALSDAPPRYNIASNGDARVLLMHDGEVAVDTLRWGLVPRWSKLPETAYSTITARLNRAPTSRIYARPWASRRCVVPMNGYYKWDRSGARPVPHFIQARSGELLFAAGVWDLWERELPPLASFALLTMPNTAIPRPLSPDGPLFLPASKLFAWLSDPAPDPTRIAGTPQPELEAYPVSKRIRSRDVDDYTLLEPAPPDAPDETDDDFDPDGDVDED
ncbi:SOS response-associated peptidase [Luteimonas fraxinea]|uniref:Abasic site processing protein n=1 Tax=Luteimonas fraxinea TaxID=2901869 RepID=A0ABS8U8T8_9GAMM|nr:SOS response-associated peptidase [Luteimonas fraxinea]MCD9095694.1 SOS response-associated peptidase [Luteimonas fraxinea]UHH11116.1 SOS response-associated peptidase [Luteimonas fraxinea]